MHSAFPRYAIGVTAPLVIAACLAGCASTGERSGQMAATARMATAQVAAVQPVIAVAAAAPAATSTISPANHTQPASLPDDAQLQRLPPPTPEGDAFAIDPPSVPPPGLVREEIIPASPVRGLAGERPTMPVDFATALGMTQGQNPRIAFAQAQISQAFAQYDSARVMWLPSIRAGTNYNKHEGRLQEVNGVVSEISRGAAFGGFGANAVGAGSPAIPGVYMQFHLTDAIHQPQIAGYALQARQQLGTAAINDQLLEAALAYLALLDALQRRAIAAETLQNGQQLVEIIDNFVRTGAGNQADADRAAASLALLRNESNRTEESVAVASARLAQQLSVDPSVILLPLEPAVVPIELVQLEGGVADLVATGLSNRPELAASRALVCEAVNRLRREQNAPWLPSVILGVSYGAFAGGEGGDITNGGDRFDFDGIAYWELRNLGYGEKAARANASAQVQQARMRQVELMDNVAREIVEAQAQVEARRQQIATAEGAIESAQNSYRRNIERIRNAQGLPIEALQSVQALDTARREYLRAVVDFNQAQFRLHRALGWPIPGV